MSEPAETDPKPEHGWTCFHCGETFLIEGAARDHFGAVDGARPGCLLKVELGAERGLLMALRKVEDELALWISEGTEIQRSMHQMQSRHSDNLRTAEEAGYARGLRDGMRMSAKEREALYA